MSTEIEPANVGSSPEVTLASTQELPFRAVQRTVVRPDQELDTQVLYVSSVTGATTAGASFRQSGAEHVEALSGPAESAAPGSLAGYGRVVGDAVVAEAGQRLTFSTYFNAFPASYWRRWTDFGSVRLVARLSGVGNLIVYRSTSKGHVVRADSVAVDSDDVTEFVLDLSLSPFIDGGWYWFDIEAGHAELVLESAEWGFQTAKQSEGRITIGITTFNRPDFCVAQLANLAGDESVLAIIDEIIVVDQGTKLVADDPDYPAAAQALGDKLRVIRQANLGGSGGFSRAMNEASEMGASDYVLLLDDDVVCELEGIHRAVALADLAKQTVLVGGQMLSLYDRSVMHAYGESIARYRWFWGPAGATEHGHDFARKSLRTTPWLHRRIDVDYNGWWMCMIPLDVIRQIGLSLPMFIKWDDAEFGLRAASAGFPTVTMPGVAVWHVPWTEKDDTLDWQAYFHERNRLISALLHSPYPRGGKLVRESLENHTKRLMSMQYSTGEIILLALQDVLDGPERMHRDIAHRLGEVRAIRSGYDDGTSAADLDAFPAPGLKKPPRKGRGIPVPHTTVGKVKMAATGLLRQVRPVRELAKTRPEGIVPHIDQRWYRLGHFDSAIVSSADGLTASWYRRDRKQFNDQMARSTRLHAKLYREWPELSQRYRDALDDLTSPQSWKPTFEGNLEP